MDWTTMRAVALVRSYFARCRPFSMQSAGKNSMRASNKVVAFRFSEFALSPKANRRRDWKRKQTGGLAALYTQSGRRTHWTRTDTQAKGQSKPQCAVWTSVAPTPPLNSRALPLSPPEAPRPRLSLRSTESAFLLVVVTLGLSTAFGGRPAPLGHDGDDQARRDDRCATAKRCPQMVSPSAQEFPRRGRSHGGNSNSSSQEQAIELGAVGRVSPSAPQSRRLMAVVVGWRAAMKLFCWRRLQIKMFVRSSPPPKLDSLAQSAVAAPVVRWLAS